MKVNGPNGTGGDTLVRTLVEGGVDVCFANPGTSEMHFTSGLDREPRMRCILGLFEGVVSGAADGYYRIARQPAATLLYLGPGFGNAIAHDLITSPAYVVIKSADRFHTQTTRPNEMWQTDFTYFKIIGWGWMYLSTVLDDYSR